MRTCARTRASRGLRGCATTSLLCVLYQRRIGQLAPRRHALYVRGLRVHQPRACCTYHLPWHTTGAHKAGLAPAALRGIAELTGIVAFLTFQALVLDRPVLPNHTIGFGIVFAGVLIVLGGPWASPVCKKRSVAV